MLVWGDLEEQAWKECTSENRRRGRLNPPLVPLSPACLHPIPIWSFSFLPSFGDIPRTAQGSPSPYGTPDPGRSKVVGRNLRTSSPSRRGPGKLEEGKAFTCQTEGQGMDRVLDLLDLRAGVVWVVVVWVGGGEGSG